MAYGNMQGLGGNTTLPMINNIGGQYYNPMEGNIDIQKPIYKFFESNQNEKKHPLKYFKG